MHRNFGLSLTNPALVIFDSFQKGHKKSAGSSSIINSKALVSPSNNNRTTARAYTI